MGCQIPWNWDYRLSLASIGFLGFESVCSGREVNTHNHCAISQPNFHYDYLLVLWVHVGVLLSFHLVDPKY